MAAGTGRVLFAFTMEMGDATIRALPIFENRLNVCRRSAECHLLLADLASSGPGRLIIRGRACCRICLSLPLNPGTSRPGGLTQPRPQPSPWRVLPPDSQLREPKGRISGSASHVAR